MKRTLNISILVGVLLVSGVGAQTPNMEYRILDLNFAAAQERSEALEADLPLWRVYSQSVDPSRPDWDEGILSVDRVVDMIRETVSPESWEEEGASLAPSWGQVVVRNTPEILDAVERFVSYLQEAILRPASVEVYLISAGKVGSGTGTLSAEATDRLLKEVKPALAGLMRLNQGRVGQLRSGERVSFLSDYDVEVAQDAQVADPIVRVIPNGLDLRVGVWSAPGEKLIVRVAGVSSSVESLKIRDSNSTWVGRLQFPVVDSHVVMGSGVLESGGGIVLGAAEGDEDRVFLVRVTGSGRVAMAPQGNCAIIPTGVADLTQPRVRSLVLGQPTRSGDHVDSVLEGEEVEPGHFLEADRLLEMIRTGVDPMGWDEDPYRSIWYASNSIFVKGPEELIGQTRAMVQKVNDAFLMNVGLEFRIGLLDGEKAAAVARGQADLAAVAGLLDTKAYASVLVGDDFRHILGREQAYLKDHDVEIAQEATIADPIVATIFGGVALQGRVSKVGQGRIGFIGEFVVQDLVGEVVAVDGNANDIGLVDVPRTTTTRARVAETLRSGRWAVVRLAPRPERGDSLAILVRARF